MNNLSDALWFSWSWIGLGGSIVLLILLLFTDTLRENTAVSRWRDTVWLSWATAFVYLPHVCEEYGMHVANGQYVLITEFRAMGVDAKFGGIPLIFFPLVNIVMTWIALPTAAALSRKNAVVGLSGMGFILVNGITHLASCVVGKVSPTHSPGSVTGIFLFLPLFIWICCTVKKHRLLPKRGLAISIASGVLAHLLLFSLYAINLLAGHIAMFICIPLVAFSPLIISALLCRGFRVR